MNNLIKILFQLKNFLFPGACAVCGGSLTETEEIRFSLCDPCQLAIAFDKKNVPENKCSLCGKPLISEKDTCLTCRNREGRSYDRLWVLYPYTGKYRKLLTAYKFNKNLALSGFFAEKIMELVTHDPLLKDAVIVPVPPRPGKIKMKGWDQIDYLVKRLKKMNKEQKVSCCLRRRKSKAQKHLSRKERMENLKGRIYLKKGAPKTVLVIDDVITTGSTMEVCASVLKEGGAQKVYGLCLLYD